MVTLEEAKKFLGLSEKSVEKDSMVQALITISLRLMETYTGLTFTEETAASKTFDGTGDDYIKLSAPIAIDDITDISIDGTSATLADFYVEDNYLYYEGGTFTEGTRNIIVTGTWGYNIDDWPKDLWLAQQMILTWLFQNNKDEIAITTRVYQSQTTTLTKQIPLPAIILLDNWKLSVL